jgi:hypothetical protein
VARCSCAYPYRARHADGAEHQTLDAIPLDVFRVGARLNSTPEQGGDASRSLPALSSTISSKGRGTPLARFSIVRMTVDTRRQDVETEKDFHSALCLRATQ